mmetsp:Transcript_883/g.1767  ORF Transcript_883/g.1767 Transcript_883/m.1767 type:complete len:89 (-) Transcript_883:353-619(-)
MYKIQMRGQVMEEVDLMKLSTTLVSMIDIDIPNVNLKLEKRERKPENKVDKMGRKQHQRNEKTIENAGTHLKVHRTHAAFFLTSASGV